MKKQVYKLIFSAFFFALALSSNFAIAHSTSQTKPAPKTTVRKPQLSAAEITEARETLGQLGYWVDLETTGLETSLHHALIAFQKIEGRQRTGVLTTEELAALRSAKRPQPREWGFAHIEVDLPRQVLFVVDYCGVTLRLLPISSGSGEWFTEGGRTRQAITPTGRFKVTHQIKGWHKSPLGLLYYPNYIHNGVAIHGNPAVPPFPASHGCIRIPMFAAKEFSEMAKVGMDVIVYDDSRQQYGEHNEPSRAFLFRINSPSPAILFLIS